jgi:hypothetical protein
VVDLLQKHFVAFALNNAGWTVNMTPAEALWLKDRGARACTQGMTVLTAGGQVLASGGGYQAAPNLRMLREALRKYRPEEAVEIGDPAAPVNPKELPDGWHPFLPRVVPRPARGGLVLYVTWKGLGPPPPAPLPKSDGRSEDQLSPKMLLVDRIWAGKVEADALAAGQLPAKLKQRLAAHLSFVMNSKVKAVDVTLGGQRLSGAFLLANGERCEALGFVNAKDGKVCRFELIVKGRTDGRAGEGSGFPSLGVVVPAGEKTTAAVAFMLADPNDELAKVQPGSGKDLRGGEEKDLNAFR